MKLIPLPLGIMNPKPSSEDYLCCVIGTEGVPGRSLNPYSCQEIDIIDYMYIVLGKSR